MRRNIVAWFAVGRVRSGAVAPGPNTPEIAAYDI